MAIDVRKVLLSRQMNRKQGGKQNISCIFINKNIYTWSIFSPAFTAVHSIFHRKYISNMDILFKYSLLLKKAKNIFALKALTTKIPYQKHKENKFGLIYQRQLVILPLLKLSCLKMIGQRRDNTLQAGINGTSPLSFIFFRKPFPRKWNVTPLLYRSYFSGSLFLACRDGGFLARP